MDNNKEKIEDRFLRIDLRETTTVKQTAFRISKPLRDFLQELIDKKHDIQSVGLDFNDEEVGKVGRLITFHIEKEQNK